MPSPPGSPQIDAVGPEVEGTHAGLRPPRRSVLHWLKLPREVTDFEQAYLRRVDATALGVLFAFVPLMALVAALNDMSPLRAMVLAALAPAGLLLGGRANFQRRERSYITAVSVMYLGALLVHFGRGLWTMEMHFAFFVGLALLIVYANPMVIVVAAASVVVHHLALWAILPTSLFNYDAPLSSVLVHALFVTAETVACVFVARTFFDNIIGLERVVSRRTAKLAAALESLRAQEKLLAQTSAVAKLGGWDFQAGDRAPRMSFEALRAIGFPEHPSSAGRLLRWVTRRGRRALISAVRESLQTGTPFALEVELAAQSPVRWARVVCQVEHADGRRRLYGSVQDFTEQHDARQAALEASKAKSQFLANMSHEVRTPLNGILGMAQLALDDELEPEQRECLELIQLSGQNLLAIVNDVLDLSRIESGRFELEKAPFDVRALVSEVIKPSAMRAQSRGLEVLCRVEAAVPEKLEGDSLRLTQVLNNLLSNAVKFTLTGCIEVHVTAPHDVLTIEVRDSGIGVPLEKQAAIFEPFVQADGSTNRRFGGTGLGLAIARELVQRMGGTLTLRSEVGCGSIFTVAVALPVSAPAPVRQVSRPLRVVCVLTPGPLQLTVCSQLTELGAQVITLDERAAKKTDQRFDVMLTLDESWSEELGALADRSLLLARSGQRRGLRGVRVLHRPASENELLAALDDVSRPSALHTPAVISKAHGLRVLLAEDNPINATLVTRLLGKLGHTVHHVVNGALALEASREGPWDLVLMDMQMPELDGLSATRAIRSEEQASGKRLHIVALTANAMTSDEALCLAAGMDGYLSKPLRRDQLDAVLAKVSGARGLRGAA
jgi:two-component system, sensor histidine kinase and response regulator